MLPQDSRDKAAKEATVKGGGVTGDARRAVMGTHRKVSAAPSPQLLDAQGCLEVSSAWMGMERVQKVSAGCEGQRAGR